MQHVSAMIAAMPVDLQEDAYRLLGRAIFRKDFLWYVPDETGRALAELEKAASLLDGDARERCLAGFAPWLLLSPYYEKGWFHALTDDVPSTAMQQVAFSAGAHVIFAFENDLMEPIRLDYDSRVRETRQRLPAEYHTSFDQGLGSLLGYVFADTPVHGSVVVTRLLGVTSNATKEGYEETRKRLLSIK